MTHKRSHLGWLLPVLVATAAVWPTVSRAQSDAIDPEAVKLLRRSTDYVAGLKEFRVDVSSAIEAVVSTGEKLQFDSHVVSTVRRPDKLRVERVGEIVNQIFYYDGTSLSVSFPDARYHASVAAPATIEATLDFARDQLDVIAPGADLMYKNAFDRLTDGLTSAYVVGEAVVGGVRCDHLAFRNPEVDWQIWIERGAKPLPRKLVITSKKMPQSPQFIAVMNKWDTAPKISDALFSFTPVKGSRKVEWQPAGAAMTK